MGVNTKSNILIVILLVCIGALIWYYQGKLLKSKIEPLSEKKEAKLIEQTKSLDSALLLNKLLKDSLIKEQNKKPIIIPKYNEKIIYISVSDTTITNAFSRERESYLQKQSRQLGDRSNNN